MRKITLNFESLSVESFEAGSAARGEGTVVGNAKPTVNGCGGSEIDNCPSSLGCTSFGDCLTRLCETRDFCETLDLTCPTAEIGCI